LVLRAAVPLGACRVRGHTAPRISSGPALRRDPLHCASTITVKQRTVMPKTDEAWTQLATRIPRELHRRLKVHSVTTDVTVMHFVIQAIEEELGRKAKKRKQRVSVPKA
jgi:hypothetical protein